MEEVTKMKVIALTQFSNGSVSMFKGEIREIDSTTAETLISNGLVEAYEPDVPPVTADDKNKYLHTNETTGEKEWSEVSGGGGGGGVLVVHIYIEDSDQCLDKNYTEINDAIKTGGACVEYSDGSVSTITDAFIDNGYIVVFGSSEYSSDTADGVLKYADK